jgi:RNA polymerase sigma factor (sigma-70 family)
LVNRFETTQWSVVVSAGGEGTSAHDALAALCRIYRPPVLAYVRARVGDSEDAEDLTQAFFAYLLERRLAARADPERGRFRAFLLTSLKHFLASERERAGTLRRGGGMLVLPSSALERLASEDAGPEQAFEREWARTVLREAMVRLEREVRSAGRAELFTHLRPYLVENPDDGEYEALAQALSLRPNTIAVAVHRLRTRLRELVREVVADTSGEGADIESELRHMRSKLVPEAQPEA